MALMSKTVFEGFVDRIAKQYSYIKVCFDALSNTGVGTQYYERITATGDPDVELAMLRYAFDADNKFAENETIAMVQSIGEYTSLITSFERHLSREGSITSRRWDDYCEQEDVRVSDYTNQVYYARNSTYMLARNVFAEDDTTLASAEMTGASTLTFTDGDDFGDGGASNLADGSSFAGAQLKAVVTGSNTISSLVVNIVGLDEEGNSKTLNNVTISGAPAAEVTIGTTADKWVDVTNIVWASGGSLSDEFELHNIKEREIAL